jgi:hypothetical protein
MVESLIKGATRGMANAVIPAITTESEIMSAVFTLLDRTLRSLRNLQSNDVRFERAAQINEALQSLMTDHGQVPN